MVASESGARVNQDINYMQISSSNNTLSIDHIKSKYVDSEILKFTLARPTGEEGKLPVLPVQNGIGFWHTPASGGSFADFLFLSSVVLANENRIITRIIISIYLQHDMYTVVLLVDIRQSQMAFFPSSNWGLTELFIRLRAQPS